MEVDQSVSDLSFPPSEFASANQWIDGNDDLFWAVMGGSPGNFGILTHVRIRPLHDKDYPDSRMMHAMTDYTPEKHRALESIWAEMSSDPELPRNYNCTLTILGPQSPMFDGPKIFEKKIKSGAIIFKQNYTREPIKYIHTIYIHLYSVSNQA